MKASRFREDLFYRLNVIRIDLPPLRERKEDIPMLARYFMERFSREHGKSIKKITEGALKCLIAYDYSGNVRELENIMERAVTLEATEAVTIEALPPALKERALEGALPAEARPAAGAETAPAGAVDLDKTVAEFEKAIIMDALKKTGGVKKRAAELLGLSFRSMRYKLSKYDIPE